MAISVIFTPHDKAEELFNKAEDDILIISPNVKSGFIHFVDQIAKTKKLVPRLITSVSSEAGSEWDREKTFSDYPELLRRHEGGRWQIRVARFNLRAYCIDRRLAIISTVNPGENGRLVPGGLWILFDDPVSSYPIVQRLEYFWNIAKDLKASEVAEALKKKGREVGDFLDHPSDQQLSYNFILAEEVALEKANRQYKRNPSDQSLVGYLSALEPFDRDGSQRIRIAEQHLEKYGESGLVYRYLAFLYFNLSNLIEAERAALKALAVNKDDMDMLSILIVAKSASDLRAASYFASGYNPGVVENRDLLWKVADVLKASFEQFPDQKLASRLLKIYHRLYELADSEKRDAIKDCARNIALHYDWTLGW